MRLNFRTKLLVLLVPVVSLVVAAVAVTSYVAAHRDPAVGGGRPPRGRPRPDGYFTTPVMTLESLGPRNPSLLI